MKKKYLIILLLFVPLYNFGQWNTTGDNYTSGTLNIKTWNYLGICRADYGYFGMCLRYKNNQWESFHQSIDGMAFKFIPNGIDFVTAPKNTTPASISTLMRINSNGNIGIGTVNPSEKLEIKGFLKAGYVSFGGKLSTESPKNYVNFASDNHGTLLISSNLYLNGSRLHIANTHSTMSGAAIKIPGNSQVRQHYIEFWTTPIGGVTAGGVYGQASPRMIIDPTGNVGIGTLSTGTHKLAVEGTIGAREIKVEAGSWSDFVFTEDYRLKDLEEVEIFIEENNHLPDIPSENEVLENGIQLGEMDAKLLLKIEELTLYMIEMNKKVNNLEKRNKELEDKLNSME